MVGPVKTSTRTWVFPTPYGLNPTKNIETSDDDHTTIPQRSHFNGNRGVTFDTGVASLRIDPANVFSELLIKGVLFAPESPHRAAPLRPMATPTGPPASARGPPSTSSDRSCQSTEPFNVFNAGASVCVLHDNCKLVQSNVPVLFQPFQCIRTPVRFGFVVNTITSVFSMFQPSSCDLVVRPLSVRAPPNAWHLPHQT